jgi:hypothetical protein
VEIQLRVLDEKWIAGAIGPFQFFWRIKIQVLIDAVAAHPEDVLIYADADTFFFDIESLVQSSSKGPVMHCLEGPIGQLCTKTERHMAKILVDKTFDKHTILPSTQMWNAGIIVVPPYLHENLKTARSLCDEFLKVLARPRIAEQFALSVALNVNGTLQDAPTVAHYWPFKESWIRLLNDHFDAIRLSKSPNWIHAFKDFRYDSFPLNAPAPKLRTGRSTFFNWLKI